MKLLGVAFKNGRFIERTTGNGYHVALVGFGEVAPVGLLLYFPWSELPHRKGSLL